MVKKLGVLAVLLAISGCGHMELKAPCGPLASLDDGCGDERAINVAGVLIPGHLS